MNGINSLLPKSVHSCINYCVRFSRVLSYLKVLKILKPFAPEPLVTARVACEQALLFGRVKRASAPRSRVLARLASLAQIGELARRLPPGGFTSVLPLVKSSVLTIKNNTVL